MVLNYLVLKCFKETAKTFAREAGLEFDDYDMDARQLINRDILSGNIEAAIEKINDLNPEVSFFILHSPDHMIRLVHAPRITPLMRKITSSVLSMTWSPSSHFF
jgi:hypothetical protein